MAIDTRFQLSRLQPLAEYLAHGADIDSRLFEALEEALPGKETDKLLKLLDKLLQEPRGALSLLLTMRYVLDEWLTEGQATLWRTNQGLEPYAWLATSDHLEVVQTFRQLL
jgi:hypothetical protein